MKKELIAELFEKFEKACYIYQGVECWSARELQEFFSYTKWDNFVNVIDKAKSACANAGAKVSDHFADIGKMIELGRFVNLFWEKQDINPIMINTDRAFAVDTLLVL